MKTKVLHIRLDDKTKAILTRRAKEEGRTLSGMIVRVIKIALGAQ